MEEDVSRGTAAGGEPAGNTVGEDLGPATDMADGKAPSELNAGNQGWDNPLKGLNRQSKLVVFTAWAGFLLVVFDTGLFNFLYPTVQKALGISLGGVAAIITAGTVLGAIGSILYGPLLDRIGRKTVFNVSLWFTAIGSALVGASGGFLSLIIIRGVASVGQAGESQAGQVMVAEAVRPGVRGFWNGFIQSAYPAGYLAAAGVAAIALPTIGWRWTFVLGLVPALAIIMARFWVKETSRFKALKQVHRGVQPDAKEYGIVAEIDASKARKFEYVQLFQRDLRRNTIFITLWQFVYNFGALSIITWIPAVLIRLGYTQGDVFKTAAIGQVLGLVGYLIAALLGNRVGRREMAALWLFMGGIAGCAFLFLGATSPVEIGIIYGAYYFFAVGQMGATLGFIPEVFPTRVRGTAIAFTYSFAAVGGGAVAAALGPVTIDLLGVTNSLFFWTGITSFLAAIFAICTKRVRPGLELEAVIT